MLSERGEALLQGVNENLSLIAPEELQAKKSKQELTALSEKQRVLNTGEVGGLYKRNLSIIEFLRKVDPKKLASRFNVSYNDLAAYAEESALKGVEITEGLTSIADMQASDRGELENVYRTYKEERELDTLDYDIIHKNLMQDEQVSDGIKQRINFARSMLMQDPKMNDLLVLLSANKRLRDFEGKIFERARTTHKLEKEMNTLDRELAKASDTNDLATVSLLEKKLEQKVGLYARMQQRPVVAASPDETTFFDVAGVMLSDFAVSATKGFGWSLPKAWSKPLIRAAEDWRQSHSDIFGADSPDTIGHTAQHYLGMVVGGALPAAASWHLSGAFLGTRLLTATRATRWLAGTDLARFGVSGAFDKMLAVGYEATFGEGLREAGRELVEGVGYGLVGGAVFLPLAGVFRKARDIAQITSLRLMDTTVGQKLLPLVGTETFDSVRARIATSLARRRMTKMFQKAFTSKDKEAELRARAVLGYLVKDVEHCPKRWHALGRDVQSMIDELEALGVKGLTHPKPSPELLYLEGLNSGADEAIVAETVAQYGKRVSELDQDLLQKMIARDKYTEGMFNHRYFNRLVEKAQKEEIKLGRSDVISKKVDEILKAKKKVAPKTQKPTKQAKPVAKPTTKSIEVLLKKAEQLPKAERNAFFKAHGITKEKLEKAMKTEQVSKKFVGLLKGPERKIYDDLAKRKGVMTAIDSVINHRVNNALTIVGGFLRKRDKKPANAAYKAALRSLIQVKKADGILVDKSVQTGVRKLSKAYKELKRKFK